MELDRSFTRIQQILDKNKDKRFVQRILNPDISPTLDNKDKSYSTHTMGYWSTDDGFFVAPTVVEDGEGGLKRLSSSDAADYAMRSGELIRFDNEQDAKWFSKNYKKYWDSIGKSPKER